MLLEAVFMQSCSVVICQVIAKGLLSMIHIDTLRACGTLPARNLYTT